MVLVFLAMFAVSAGAAGIKLYLKDGSYQLVKSYEVEGDRVRFYSLERSDWEEIPVSMVDFEATQRAQTDEKAAQQKRLEEAHKLDTERFDETAPAGFEIAPGVRLPVGEGIYAFDGDRVIGLIQSSSEIIRDKKRIALSMALPAPLLKNRNLVVLEGAKAAVRIRATKPAFYVQFAGVKPEDVQLIPVTTKKDLRVLEQIQSGIGVGKSGEIRDAIPVERKEIKPGLLLLHPLQPLPAGEYALGEILSQKLNLEVWDFGIDGR
ncbi:MAG TPA: hypothetical protein VFM21_01125 [Terriglobia bacterium]|nr:hypothetical protein [Terriglobia bacterium]